MTVQRAELEAREGRDVLREQFGYLGHLVLAREAVEAECLIRVGEAATFLGVSRFTIWRWANDPDRDFPPIIRLSRDVAGWPLNILREYRDRHTA